MLKTGELLKICRTNAGLRQTDLANRTHSTQTYISLVERGKSDPKVSWLENMLNACGYELGIREKVQC